MLVLRDCRPVVKTACYSVILFFAIHPCALRCLSHHLHALRDVVMAGVHITAMNSTKAAGAMTEESMEFSPACLVFTADEQCIGDLVIRVEPRKHGRIPVQAAEECDGHGYESGNGGCKEQSLQV